jgi:hypothetical protein
MNRFAAIAVLSLFVGFFPTSSPAVAGGRCATRAEYRHIDQGMRKAQVNNIFGWSGRRADSSTYVWAFCPQFRPVAVGVVFDHRHVDFKYIIWGD